MNKTQLNKLLISFSKGILSWVDMAIALNQAVEEEIEINGEYIKESKMSELLRAYRFANEKNILNDPRLLKISSRVVANLVNIEKVVKNPEYFKKIKKDALDGKITATGLEKISLKAKGLEGNFPYKSIKKRIMKLIEDFSDESKIIEYRKFLATDCAKLAQLLQCIIDEEYYELWKSRKEYKV